MVCKLLIDMFTEIHTGVLVLFFGVCENGKLLIEVFLSLQFNETHWFAYFSHWVGMSCFGFLFHALGLKLMTGS